MPSDDEYGPRGARGRKLPGRRPTPPAPPDPTPADARPAAGPVDPRAPFTAHQADPSRLSGAPDRSAARRAPLLVGATVFVSGLFGVLLIGLVVAESWRSLGPEPVQAATAPRHLSDPGYRGPIVDDLGPATPVPAAPTAGPIRFVIGAEHDFVSIGVKCPESGFVRRGRFEPRRRGTQMATVQNVPPGEKCTVTFQGSQAATTWAFAHETRECTFNPTVCPVR